MTPSETDIRPIATDNRFRQSGYSDYLTGLVMHDLKTPLQCIFLLSEQLTSIHPEVIGKIQNCVREMNDMIGNLQGLRHKSQSVAESLPRTSLRGVLNDVCAVCPGKEKITIDAPREDVLIPMERQDLFHTLQNLITNSIRHGGEQIRINIRAYNGRTCIDYSDSGPGIPDLVWKHIRQQPYPTVHSKSDGQGLRMLYGFLRMHQADLLPFQSGEFKGIRIVLEHKADPTAFNSETHPKVRGD